MEKPDNTQQISPRIKKLPVGCIGLIGLCVAVPLYFLMMDSVFYPIWVNIIAPTPHQIVLNKPGLLVEKLMIYFPDINWSKDGSLIRLANVEKRQEMLFDVNSREEVIEIHKNTFDPAPQQNTSFTHETCPTHSYSVEVLPYPIDEWPGNFKLILLKGVERSEYQISPMQNESNIYHLYPYDLAFSPDCNWLAITLWGNVGSEQEARNELWLLHVENQQLYFAFFGRWPTLRTWDYPVQSIRPSWSPNSKEFVFGDEQFGLEIYNVERGERRWLVGPERAGYSPVWSNKGKWIAAHTWDPGTLIIISADGKFYDSFQGCRLFFDYFWSPTEDRLVFRCLKEHEDSIWIWNIDEVENE